MNFNDSIQFTLGLGSVFGAILFLGFIAFVCGLIWTVGIMTTFKDSKGKTVAIFTGICILVTGSILYFVGVKVHNEWQDYRFVFLIIGTIVIIIIGFAGITRSLNQKPVKA